MCACFARRCFRHPNVASVQLIGSWGEEGHSGRLVGQVPTMAGRAGTRSPQCHYLDPLASEQPWRQGHQNQFC